MLFNNIINEFPIATLKIEGRRPYTSSKTTFDFIGNSYRTIFKALGNKDSIFKEEELLLLFNRAFCLMAGLVCFSVPLPASITGKELTKIYNGLLLIIRRTKLVYKYRITCRVTRRITYRLIPGLTTPLRTVPGLTPPLRTVTGFNITRRVLPALTLTCRAVPRLTRTCRVPLPSLRTVSSLTLTCRVLPLSLRTLLAFPIYLRTCRALLQIHKALL